MNRVGYVGVYSDEDPRRQGVDSGDQSKWRSCELGTWIPLDEGMAVLEMNGAMQSNKVRTWLANLGVTETHLEDEGNVNIGSDNEDDRSLVLKLLRAYRNLVTDTGHCPPVTALDTEHHVDT